VVKGKFYRKIEGLANGFKAGFHGITQTVERKRKVLPAYSRALPIHAKSGRERGPECALSLNGRQDDELEKDYYRV